jgi:2-oxoglutarate ferredoxin oxidoreductase subunit delta
MSSIRVKIDKDKCKSCGLCVEFCPQKVIKLSDKLNIRGVCFAEVKNGERCVGCKQCAVICPDTCIELVDIS